MPQPKTPASVFFPEEPEQASGDKADRVVLSDNDASTLVDAYQLLAKIAERVGLNATPQEAA